MRRLAQLFIDFDRISKTHIRRIFFDKSSFFAPAFVTLQAALDKTDAERGWKLLLNGRPASKGKSREVFCVELEMEKNWLGKRLREFALARRSRVPQADH